MSLAPGTRLGSFDIIGLVGAGGMGTVYRAYDPRLQREVAVKVLPPDLANDPERLRRFEHEARAVARLAHPNIVAIHDIGAHDGGPFLVTELIEGASLRETMQGRPVPVRKALDYAVQAARGLAAAHEQGVVHRDIKPENLVIGRDGRLKILDFGIAKLTDAGSASDTAVTLTQQGIAIGTAAYMAPEQVRGGRIDGRADLFSLGVVLYEMVSGISPFRRDTAVETMTAVLRDDPPELPASTACSPALDRTIRHLLEKNPQERFQTARDLIFALESISGTGSQLTPELPQPRSRRRLVVGAVAAAMALVATAAYIAGRGSRPVDDGVELASIQRHTDFTGLEEFPAVAPDLKSIAFTARVNGVRQVFVRLIAGGTPLQVTQDLVDHEMPRWSADASSLIYFSPAAAGSVQGTIWEIPALGGAPRRILDSVGGGDVDRTGRIAAFRKSGGGIELVTMTPDAASVQAVARFDEPVYYRFPRWSPDGEWIAYQRGDGVRWDLFLIAARGGTAQQLTHDRDQIYGLAWSPNGEGIIYSSGRTATMPYLPTLGLWHVSIRDGKTRRLALADQSYFHPDTHPDGTIVASRLQLQFNVWKYPLDGNPRDNTTGGVPLTRQTGQLQTPTAGADDRRIAFLSDSGGHANIWVANTATGELRQITHERDPLIALGVPIWSPDGTTIAFVSSRGNVGLDFGVWVVDPDGGNLRRVADRGLGVTWAPDSSRLYYVDPVGISAVDVRGGAPVRIRPGPARNVVGFDGSTLYYMVDRTLTDGSPGFEIHAATPASGPSRVLAQIPVSRAPQWQIINPSLSPDGTRLAMPLTDGVTTNIWTLSTRTSEWRQVTDFGDRPTFIARRVSWSPDGKSIIAAVGEGDADIVLFEPGRQR